MVQFTNAKLRDIPQKMKKNRAYAAVLKSSCIFELQSLKDLKFSPLVNSILSDYIYALSKTVIPAWIARIQVPGMIRSPSLALNARFPAGMRDFPYNLKKELNRSA